MRTVRWNKRYLTGDSRVDERNQALVSLLADLGAELGRIEHCAEMNDLAAKLAGLTKQRLSLLPENPGPDADSEAAIRSLLNNDFPLAARSTPACRECGLCDLMADRVARWLSEGSEV